MAQSMTGSFDESVELRHEPDRRNYLCLACETAWPCNPAREQLIASVGDEPFLLHVVMWSEFDQAAMGPLRSEPIGALIERFLRWIPVRGGGSNDAEIRRRPADRRPGVPPVAGDSPGRRHPCRTDNPKE
nr:hypothetical protein Ade03nite_14870 [Actinoplanes derwentensis]